MWVESSKSIIIDGRRITISYDRVDAEDVWKTKTTVEQQSLVRYGPTKAAAITNLLNAVEPF